MSDISAEKLEAAFWRAGQRTLDDESLLFAPYFDEKMDMVDATGCGMPKVFWDYFAEELNNE